jgi:hypothetical protein
MNKEGPLHCKYIIEDNTELQDKTIFMIKRDLEAQWLAGDELKRDQFKFNYKVMKIIYDSALKDQLLNEHKEVVETVLPSLAAYQSLLIIKGILDTKEWEKKKEKEKLELEGGLSLPKKETIVEEQQPVPEPSPTKASPAKKGAKPIEVVFEKSEAEKEREAKLEEIKKYGVSSNLVKKYIALMDLGRILQ